MVDSGAGTRSTWVDTEHYSFTTNPDFSDNAILRDLKDYWDRKRGDRPMPTRADIDPVELRAHLGWIILVDVLPERDDFRYRLIGTNIVQVFGRDSTGKTVRDLRDNTGADYVDITLDVYRTVAEQAVVARTAGSLRAIGRDYRRFECVFLPLDRGDGTVGMILVEQRFF